jgi:hypothetical protein
MRFLNLIVLLFALLLVSSSALKIGNPIKKVEDVAKKDGDTVKKVAGNLPEVAKCAAQGAPYVAPLGSCMWRVYDRC